MSFAADVYAFAVLAWVVCTGERPYQNVQSLDTAVAAMLMQATPTPTPTLYALPLRLDDPLALIPPLPLPVAVSLPDHLPPPSLLTPPLRAFLP